MKFDAIFYALEVADAGSFSQAARNLYLSQPNLSYAVRQLEEDLGVRLFDRIPGGVVPTEAGQALIERFRIIRRDRLPAFQPRRPGVHQLCPQISRGGLPVRFSEL